MSTVSFRLYVPATPRKSESHRQKPSRPSCRNSREKTSVRPTWSKSTAGQLLDPVHEDLERVADARPAGRPDSSLPRSIRCQGRAQDRVAHTRYDPLRAGDGDRRDARATVAFCRRPAFAERTAHPGLVHLRRDLHRGDLRARRGRVDRVHHQVPPRQEPTVDRGTADPRRDAPRDHLDGAPGLDARGDRGVRLLRAAGHRRRPEGCRRRRDDASRSRAISSTGSSATRTAPSRSTGWSRRPTRWCTRTSRADDYDVIHSWWVPDLGGKYDAIPGRVNKTWFQAPVGTYVARCAELCGIQHALMDGTVDVVPRDEYRRVHRPARREREQRRRSATRSGSASARSATGSTTRTSARRSRATRCSATAAGSRRCCGTAAATCRPSGRTGPTPRSTRSSRGRSSTRPAGRPARWPSTSRASARTVRDWRRGKVASWLTTVDHKRIGILYIARRSSSSRWAECWRC